MPFFQLFPVEAYLPKVGFVGPVPHHQYRFRYSAYMQLPVFGHSLRATHFGEEVNAPSRVIEEMLRHVHVIGIGAVGGVPLAAEDTVLGRYLVRQLAVQADDRLYRRLRCNSYDDG